MRRGGCRVQQALTPEAASLVKQAVTLARRRGHAQVTPLHVANTMLAASTGLLRTACLQSHNHPLQCRALELCFNVALNRLPASTSMLQGHHHQLPQYPSISNALVAAFKRAQAHQRRGSIDTQQPLLAVKIELEQLIISILDDPSVSRVMREAGFSSTQVKSNVEQAVSLEICSQQTAAKTTTSTSINSNSSSGESKENNEDEVSSVIEKLARSRRGVVIVGESLSTAEGVLKGVMERVEKGEVPEVLRHVKFVSVRVGQFSDDLKGAVRGHMEKGGVVLNLGDLRGGGRSWSWMELEHLVMELRKLSCNNNNDKDSESEEEGRLWMVGVATFQTYTNCKSSVEAALGLHPLTIPAGILRLSLLATHSGQSTVNINNSPQRDQNGGRSSWIIIQQQQHLNGGYGYGYGKLENNNEGGSGSRVRCRVSAGNINNSSTSSSCCNTCDSPTSSNLPAWLQPYSSHNHPDSVSTTDVCEKWNASPNLQITSDHHHTTNSTMRSLTFASLVSPSPSPSTSISHLHPTTFQSPWRSSSTTTSPSLLHLPQNFCPTQTLPTALRLYIPDYSNNKHQQQNPPPFFSSNPNSLSTSSSDTDYYTHRFNSLNSDNLKTLCAAMENKVPRQRHLIPDIATTILQCRSGMINRRRSKDTAVGANKEDTWLFFQGADVAAKEEIAREIARLVFGSRHRLLSISLSNFSSARADSTCSSITSCKRGREDEKSYVERFAEAVGRDPHRVFFVEDVEQADYCSQAGFKRAMESGRVRRRSTSCGEDEEEVRLGDAIVILSCEESFSCRSSRASSPTYKHKMNEGTAKDGDDRQMEEGETPCLSLDLNICIKDDDGEEVESIDDIGILVELVDRRIVFKLPREEDQL